MTGTFDFTSLGFTGTFTDPDISVDPTTVNIEDVAGLLVQCNVTCTGSDYVISPRVPSIIVQDFNYDYDQLIERVETRLLDFKI